MPGPRFRGSTGGRLRTKVRTRTGATIPSEKPPCASAHIRRVHSRTASSPRFFPSSSREKRDPHFLNPPVLRRDSKSKCKRRLTAAADGAGHRAFREWLRS
eukprot:354551-Chlamydomonas_euryale.AAC.10